MVAIISHTQVRALALHELPLCEPFAQAFYTEKGVPGHCSMEKFIQTWTLFLTQYPSILFGLWSQGALVGGLGGLITPDLYDGRLTATEMFWYVTPDARQGRNAWTLVDAFETWGKDHGAVECRLAFLLLGWVQQANPMRLLPLYQRRGYQAVDLGCIKTFG